MTTARPTHDVVIMGGGLAGLTLALQLKGRLPELDVLVLERRGHPVPHATHKVGESSVEIGAHYFDTVLGLKSHLDGAQLRKFGFRFFFSEGRRDFDQVLELGASHHMAVPSYQIDRGIFENYLAEEAQRRGVRFVDAARVDRVALAEDVHAPHRISWQRDGRRTRPAPAGWSTPAAAPGCSSASSIWPSRTGTTSTRCGFASARASRSTAGATATPGRRAARRAARAGSRPTIWWAPATGSG